MDTSAVAPHTHASHFPSVIERYYTQRFAIDVNGPGEDVYVYTHTNGLMVIGLAPGHPIVRQGLTVTKVEFSTEHRDFAKNVVRGAKKKGGARLRPEALLATITCDAEIKYSVNCCVNASLLEVNAQLQTNPNLLSQKAGTNGYLLLCQPLYNDKHPAENLMSLEEYQQLRFPSDTSVSNDS